VIVCGCTRYHSSTCRWHPLVRRYHDVWMKAHRRYLRRRTMCERSDTDRDCDLADEAAELLGRIASLWDVVSSPELLRRLQSDLQTEMMG
jgi:hypothetical protein